MLLGSLDQLVQQHSARIEPYLFTRAIDPLYDKFSALHAACWSGGMLLFVPKGVRIERPLHMFSTLSSGKSDFGHALIVLEEGAEATVLAETASSDPAAAGLHCGAVEILVGPGARLRYVNLQNWGGGVWHFAHQKALVGRDASLQWTIGALGSRLAKVNQHVALVDEGAHAQVNGVMFTDGGQHLSYHTHQHHEAPHCTSDLLYKGALQGESRIVWRGMIKVDRDAQKTDGYQRDDNLILSESARADSIPGLEIEADDVKCTHGATAGRVDDEQVFYAQARGLTRKEAVRMIVSGFFQQVFDRITVESVREALVRRSVEGCGNMSDFVPVCKVGDLPDPGKQIYEVGERFVVVFHVDGQFYALDDMCTHDGGPLGEGSLEGFTIACPRHGANSTSATAACFACPLRPARRRTKSKWRAARCW